VQVAIIEYPSKVSVQLRRRSRDQLLRPRAPGFVGADNFDYRA